MKEDVNQFSLQNKRYSLTAIHSRINCFEGFLIFHFLDSDIITREYEETNFEIFFIFFTDTICIHTIRGQSSFLSERDYA